MMNTKKMFRPIGIAIIAMMILAVSAFAARGIWGHGEKGGEDRMEKMVDKLQLTADQQARIKGLRDQFKTDNAALFQQMKDLHEQMKAAKESGNEDQAKGLRAQMQAKRESLQVASQNLQAQIKAILTPEQQQKAEQFMAEGRGHCRGGMHGCRNGGKDKDARPENQEQPAPGSGTIK
jgi:Spy/CpxP family protein refolding chaperone